jgi:hypothetical protein
MAFKSFHALVLGAALLVGWPSLSLSAQDGRGVEADRSYPRDFETAFEWRYSCANGKSCSFDCPGSGGASHVTKLAIRLGSVHLGSQNAGGIFYEFSTMEILRSNGFNITTGISTVSCQVNGMNLDYSGSTDTPTGRLPICIDRMAALVIRAVDQDRARQRRSEERDRCHVKPFWRCLR